METLIIAQVEASDRNIYLTIDEDGALVKVNYSQGLGDIDLHFLNTYNQELTYAVIKSLEEQDETWSAEHFFPSPYWDDQVNLIDNAIWMILDEENEIANKMDSILLQINELDRQLSELKNKLKINKNENS
jgi:hypothetical protein